VNLPARFEGDERVRLFCALRLPPETVEELLAWQRDSFAGVPGIRPVPADNLHVTLAFLGHQPVAELEAIAGALRETAERAERPLLALLGYRETRSVGMLTFEALGVYEPERRRWRPHVTVLRFRERPRLQPVLPALEPFVTSDAAAYLSRLRPGGAQYEVLESMAVGGR